MPMRLLLVVSCVAFGCAAPDVEGACTEFVAAANDCHEERAQGGEPKLIDASLCETDTSEATHDELQAAVDRYECKADAFASANCSTSDGYESAIAADAACD